MFFYLLNYQLRLFFCFFFVFVCWFVFFFHHFQFINDFQFYQKNYDQYDGFVILHGTDTMAYTASALSFMLEDLGKPVVLTGAQVRH